MSGFKNTQKLGETCTLQWQESNAIKTTKAIRLCTHCGKYAIPPSFMQSVPDGLIAYINNDGKIQCVDESTWELIQEQL